MIEIRGLDLADVDAAWRQNQLAFGSDASREYSFRTEAEQGLFLAAYDAGQMVGVAELRPYRQWYAGRDLPMTGLGGVSVAPHARGRGVARTLLSAALRRMHDDGAAVSVLYPSNPMVYRSVGWESAGVLASAELPTAALAGARAAAPLDGKDAGEPVSLRPVTAGDLDTVHRLYTDAVRGAVGPLTRTGPLFDPARLLDLGGALLAERDGAAVGYVSYDRGGDPPLRVHDLVGTDPVALAALLRSVGSWQPVAATVWIRAVDPTLLTLCAPTPVPMRSGDVWMARLVDVEAAVAGRGWPPGVRLGVDLELIDPEASWQAGRWRLNVVDSSGTLERGGTGAVRVHVRGLSALFTGFASTVALRAAGLLDGDAEAATRLDAAFTGPAPWMVDYF
jgi:predicted acetyltransferase